MIFIKHKSMYFGLVLVGLCTDSSAAFSTVHCGVSSCAATASTTTTSTSTSSKSSLHAIWKPNNSDENAILSEPSKPPQTNSSKNNKKKSLANFLGSILLTSSVMTSALWLAPPSSSLTTASFGPAPAYAESSKVVGALKGSGLVFKDTLQIERFEDPKVKGVVLYISNFDRPITEKLNKNFFNDPSYASVACARTGKPIQMADNVARGPQGEEVFEESRSLLFKTLRVQRIFDEEKNTIVYVSFNTRLDKNDDTNKSRFKSSLCAVNLDDPISATAGAATPASAP